MASQEFSLNKQSDRNFGLVFAAFFLIITCLKYYSSGSVSYIFIGLMVICIILAIFTPSVLRPFNTVWLKFGLLLNKIMSPIIMSIVFFLVVTPIGICMRVLGKRPLNIGSGPKQNTYWLPYTSDNDEHDSMNNQF